MLNAPLLTAAVDAFKIPDLRRKLLFMLGMLVASRFIAHVPIPGADLNAPLQAYGTPNLINFSTGGGAAMIKNFGFDQDPLGTLAIVISMTAGTLLLVWMGELITQYGVGWAFRSSSLVASSPACPIRFCRASRPGWTSVRC
jgi:preprotein translocase subunit SecY